MKIVMVGEAPARRDTGGGVLDYKQLSGIKAERVNLFTSPMLREGKGSAFDLQFARGSAMLVTYHCMKKKLDLLMLVGKRVALSFGIKKPEYFKLQRSWIGCDVVVIPHPSGVNRWWNSSANRRKMKRFVGSL